MTILAKNIGSVAIGEPLTFRSISVFPLTQTVVKPVDYVSLSSAFSCGAISIRETSDHGTVPFVRLENRGNVPVLLVDGEELIGAKQNRILNLTILAPAKATLDIPVTCVEAGRWGYRGQGFTLSNRTAYAGLRAQKMVHVTRNMTGAGSRAGDQSAIWADIAGKSTRMGTFSETGAMSDIFASNSAELQDCVDNLRPKHHQVGAVFAILGQMAGVECFESTDIFAELQPKLVRSYALDAIEAGHRPFTVPNRQSGIQFLESVKRISDVVESPAVGLGHELRFGGQSVIGSALCRGERVVHLSALPVNPKRATRDQSVRSGFQ